MELFQRNGQLDEDVEDILYELGNVGVGMVSTTIGSMLGVRGGNRYPGDYKSRYAYCGTD